MRYPRLSILLTILLTCGALGARPATAHKQTSHSAVRLAYRYRIGQVHEYRACMTVMVDMGLLQHRPSTVTTVYVLRQRVLRVLPDGSAVIREWAGPIATGSGTRRPGTASSIPFPRMLIIEHVSKYGRVLSTRPVSRMLPTMRQVMGRLARSYSGNLGWSALPRHPVSVGQTWKQNIAAPGAAGTVSAVFKLIQVTSGPDRVAEIKGTFNGSLTAVAGPAEAAQPARRSGRRHAGNASVARLTGTEIVRFSISGGVLLSRTVRSETVLGAGRSGGSHGMLSELTFSQVLQPHNGPRPAGPRKSAE